MNFYAGAAAGDNAVSVQPTGSPRKPAAVEAPPIAEVVAFSPGDIDTSLDNDTLQYHFGMRFACFEQVRNALCMPA
jgi:hypothetical protein